MDSMQDYLYGGHPLASEPDVAIARGKTRRTYYWIWAIYQGKLFIDGPYRDEQEAYIVGNNKIRLSNFSVIGLNTRDMGRATQAIKHNRIMETSDVLGSLQRARHKI